MSKSRPRLRTSELSSKSRVCDAKTATRDIPETALLFTVYIASRLSVANDAPAIALIAESHKSARTSCPLIIARRPRRHA